MNEAMLVKVAEELIKVPYKIKNVLLVVNCEDFANRNFAGSNMIWLSPEIDPHLLSHKEKTIIFAEIIKRLSISIEDVIYFLNEGK